MQISWISILNDKKQTEKIIDWLIKNDKKIKVILNKKLYHNKDNI